MAPHRVRRTAQSLKRDIGLAAKTATPIHNVDDVTQDHAQTRAMRTIVLSAFCGTAFYFATTKARSVTSARPPARETRVAGLLCHWKRLHFAIGSETG